MADHATVPVGAVLCGGRSSRFGRDKALATVGAGTMGDVVVAALRAAGCDPVMAIGGTAGPSLGIPTVPDRHPGQGPLAGLATALRWVDSGAVIVVPCDLPLLTGAHVARLWEAYRNGPADGAVVAVADRRPQPQFGAWPASWGAPIADLVRAGHRAWRDALTVGEWATVALPPAALADADTEADLAALLGPGGPDRPDQGRSGPDGGADAARRP